MNAHDRLLRFRGWRGLLLLGGLCILPAMILSPSRPLWPAVTLSQKLAAKHPHSVVLQRLAVTYDSYAHRNDVLAPLRRQLPPEVHRVGFVASSNDPTYSLWRPFGQREVIDLRESNPPGVRLPPDIEWLVVKRTIWSEVSHQSLEDWAAAHHAKIVSSVPITTLISWGEEPWCILQVEKEGKG